MDDFIPAYEAGLSVDHATTPTSLTNSTFRLWNRQLPFLPLDVVGVFKTHIGVPVKVQIHLNDICTDISVQDMDSQKFAGNFVVFLNEQEASHGVEGNLSVEPAHHGCGIGTKFLKAKMNLFAALGHKSFHFTAGLQNGAYSWSRLGAYVDMRGRFDDARQDLSRRLIARLDAMKPYISLSDYAAARPLCRIVAKDALIRLARMSTILPEAFETELRKSESPIVQTLKDFYSQNRAGGERSDVSAYDARNRMRSAFDIARMQKVDLTLGRCMLSCTSVRMKIDFTDQAQMANVANYTGSQKRQRTVERCPP